MPDRSAVRVISRRPAKAALTKTYATKAPPQFERSLGGFAAAFRWWLLAVAVVLLAAFPAFAEAPSRVRGVVTAVDNGSITVEQRDGRTVTLKASAETAYAYVVPSSLDVIRVNDFVGTAVKGPPSAMVAVELVIIPDGMRAGRISYYGWDPLTRPRRQRHVRHYRDPHDQRLGVEGLAGVAHQHQHDQPHALRRKGRRRPHADSHLRRRQQELSNKRAAHRTDHPLRGGRPVGSRHRLQRFHQDQPWQPGRPCRRRQGRYATHVRLPRHPLLQKAETWLPAAKRRRTNQEKFMSQNISLLKALLKVEASPSAPRLSSAQLLDAPENKAIQDIWALPPDNPRLHAGSRIAVLATDGVEEIEINTVLHYFRSRGARVDLIAPRLPRYPTALGIQFPAIRETHIMTITYVATGGWIKFDRLLEDAAGDDYDAVVVPGGAWNPDTLRAEPKAISFVQKAASAGKIVAAICHGPWVISDAGLTRGKRVTGWLAIRPDLENAGATFIDEPAVTDGNIVTSRGPLDIAAFIYAIDELLIKQTTK